MTTRARRLRRNLTDTERKLWRVLRRDQLLGLNFRRQHPIGPYVLDLYCAVLRLAIELDGGQHNYRTKQIIDGRRTRWLMESGITVLRFWNSDVLQNPDGVLSEVVRVAERLARERTPSLSLPLSGGGNERPPQ
jgi:very-short-patch-repair endonuclease